MATIYLEKGKSRVVAFAWEWPGWCRFGKTSASAVQALNDYATRYAQIAEQAGLPFDVAEKCEIVEVEGTGNTDWAPAVILPADCEAQSAEEGKRRAKLLRAAWERMNQVVAISVPILRKGPRGGGRDRDKIAEHVIMSERSYARKIGISQPPFDITDAAAIAAFHEHVLATLSAPSDGSPLAPNGWPPAYAFRRIAWHVVDHTWEIEDRQE